LAPQILERASRLILIGSTVIAGAVHAWLSSGRPGLAPAAVATFFITLLLARVSLVAALVPVLAATYCWPALAYIIFGVSDYHTMLVWLAALAGVVLSQAGISRWHIASPWRVPFVAWALVIAVSWPIVAGRELDFSLIAATTLSTTNAAFGAPPRLAAAWVVLVALAQMIGILWFDMLWARFVASTAPTFERVVLVPLIAGATIGALAGAYQGLVDIEWLNVFIWARGQRAGGLMLDANTFGMGAAMWAPVVIALAWRFGRGMVLAWTAFGLLAVAMWTAGSRTALLAFTIGTLGVMVALAQRRGIWQPRMAPIALLLGSAVLILAMAVAPRGGNSPNPLQRAFDRLPRLEAGDISRFTDEMWTRFGYGKAAADITAEHPLTGIGVGAFHVVAPDYIYRDTRRIPAPDNAQNWWRHQIAELGMLGALPSVWISFLLITVLWRGTTYVEPLGVTTILRTVLIGVGVASVLGVPTQHPATWLSFATLLFWLIAPLATTHAPPVRPSRLWLVSLSLAVWVAAGQAISARQDLRVPLRALRSQLPYEYGLSPVEGLSEHGDLRWAAKRAVVVMPVPNRWLQVTVWAPHADVQSRPVIVRIGLNGQQVVEHTISDYQPVSYFLQMPEDTRWTLLEISGSRDVQPERALQVAMAWKRELPSGVPHDRVVQ
jgi:hypothetical protein